MASCVGGLDGEAARDRAVPPRIGSRMTGAERTTLSRMIANGLPTFSWVTRAKRRLPALSKLIRTAGWPSSSKSWPGVGDLLAGDHRPALDARCRAAAFGIGQDLAADRRRGPPAAARRSRPVDQLELEPRGAADQPLQRLRILQPGHLDEDPVGALADDRRLERAERVDAPVDDVAADLHRLPDRLVEPGLGRAHRRPAGRR